MAKQDNERKRRQNRATDPFGGPRGQGNVVSWSLVLLAIGFFLVLQWTGGDLGGLFNAPAAVPTLSAPGETRQPTVEASNDEDEAKSDQTAQATATRSDSTKPEPTSTAQARGVQTPRATRQPTPTANAPPATRASDLPTIAYEELPPEAHDTIALIEQGGPFPYNRDGITFQNRERLLPIKPSGYYREYTVITPGVDHRGARRIVTGENGEMYYTDDHYESFREIVR